MPRMDETGPMGIGQRTCRRIGYGLGCGSGFKRGLGRCFATYPSNLGTEKEFLQGQKEFLEKQLDVIDKELKNL